MFKTLFFRLWLEKESCGRHIVSGLSFGRSQPFDREGGQREQVASSDSDDGDVEVLQLERLQHIGLHGPV